MNIKGKVLNIKKDSYKEEAIANHLKERTLEEGINNVNDFDNRLIEQSKYTPPSFFPLDSLTNVFEFKQAMNDLLVEAKSIERYSSEYESSIEEEQKKIYSSATSLLDNYFLAKKRATNLEGYLKYVHRTLGSNIEVYPIHFNSPSEKEEDENKYHFTFNNQVTLPIQEKVEYKINNIEINIHENHTHENHIHVEENTSMVQLGSILFHMDQDFHEKNITFRITLEQEVILNHIEIPMILPLLSEVNHIKFLDSNNRQTHFVDSITLNKLANNNPTSLELILSPIPCKVIEIHYDKDLSTRNLYLTKEVTTDYMEKNLSSSLAIILEEINARNQGNQEIVDSLISESLSYLSESLDIQNKYHIENREKFYLSIFGLFINCSLVTYADTGLFSTLVYEGLNVKYTSLILEGYVFDLNNQLVKANEENNRNTFIESYIKRVNYDEEGHILQTFLVSHPSSKPYHRFKYQLVKMTGTAIDKDKTFINLNDYINDSSDIEVFVSSNSNYYPIPFSVEIDSKNLITKVIFNSFSNQDIVIKYKLPLNHSFNGISFSYSHPYYISSTGSVIYQTLPVKFTDLYLTTILKRMSFSPYLTPILDHSAIIVGHSSDKTEVEK